MLKYIPYVLLFMLATMLIYGWGLMRAQRQDQDLMNLLYSKCRRKLLKELKQRPRMNQPEIERLLQGTQAGQIFSRKRVAITQPKAFAKSLLEFMLKNGDIIAEPEKHQTYYRLKPKEK